MRHNLFRSRAAHNRIVDQDDAFPSIKWRTGFNLMRTPKLRIDCLAR